MCTAPLVTIASLSCGLSKVLLHSNCAGPSLVGSLVAVSRQ